MKTCKLTILALLLALTTACVVYDPAMYPSRRVVVQREQGPRGPGVEYEYVEPAYPAAPAVVFDPFYWLFGPWCFDGYYHGPYGYYGYYGHHGGYHDGYRGGGYHGGYHGDGGHGGYRGGGGHGGYRGGGGSGGHRR